MITTAKASPKAQHQRYHSRRVLLSDFDFIVAEDGGDNRAERQYLRRILQYGCIRCLSAEERDVVERYYIHGQKLTEIAAASGVSASTLSRRLCRARHKLTEFAEEAAMIRRICRITRQEDLPS